MAPAEPDTSASQRLALAKAQAAAIRGMNGATTELARLDAEVARLEHEAKAVACLISSKLMKPPPDSAGATGWGHVELPIKTVEIMIADRLLFAAPSIA